MSKTPKPRKASDTFSQTPTTERQHLSLSGRTPVSRNPLSRAVVLEDWWLVPVEGKGLAVAGLANKVNGPSFFCSSTIVKRHDATTLETFDGIVITVVGSINGSRSVQNGIPIDICNHFLIGFPYLWEEHAVKFRSKRSTDRDESMKNSSTSQSTVKQIFLDDFNDLSAIEIRDFFRSSHSTGYTLNDILGEKYSNNQKSTPRSKTSKRENRISVTTTKHSLDETPRDRTKVTTDVEGNSKADEESITPIGKDRTGQKRRHVQRGINADEKSIPPRIGVVTRSMSRLRNLRDCNSSRKMTS